MFPQIPQCAPFGPLVIAKLPSYLFEPVGPLHSNSVTIAHCAYSLIVIALLITPTQYIPVIAIVIASVIAFA